MLVNRPLKVALWVVPSQIVRLSMLLCNTIVVTVTRQMKQLFLLRSTWLPRQISQFNWQVLFHTHFYGIYTTIH